MTGVLRNRAFRQIGLIYAFDAFVEWFGSVALMVAVYAHTGSASAAAGLLVCKQVAPGLLVPFVGPQLDRMGVERALGLALAVQAGSLFSIALIGFGPLLFLLAVVSGSAGSVVRSLVRTGIARSLRGDDLRAGNALTNMAMAAIGLIAPGLAALVVSSVGVGAGLAGAAAIATMLVAIAVTMPAIPALAADEAAADEPKSTASRRPSPLSANALLVLTGAMAAMLAMDEPALLAYSEHSLHAGVGGYGAIFVAWGIGLTLGSAVFARVLDRPLLVVAAFGTVAVSVAYIAMGLSASIVLTCAISVVGGLGNGLSWVALLTAIQEATPRGFEARTATRFETVSLAAPGIGILFGGLLSDTTTPRATLLIPGGIVLAGLLLSIAAVRLLEARSASDGVHTFIPSIPGGSA